MTVPIKLALDVVMLRWLSTPPSNIHRSEGNSVTLHVVKRALLWH